MKKFIILILILPLTLLADVNFNKFGSVFKNPVKWMATMPINQITLDELIMNLVPLTNLLKMRVKSIYFTNGAQLFQELLSLLRITKSTMRCMTLMEQQNL